MKRIRIPFTLGMLVPAAIVLVLITVTFAGTRISNGVRAYVSGESLWSKAQKQGVAALYLYAATRDTADFQAYVDAQRVPDADRRAREELQGPDPDPRTAAAAFIEGGNHPGDATEMVWVFRYFGRAPYFREAIAIWGEADRARDELDLEARELDRIIRSGITAGPAVLAVLDRIAIVDLRLTQLESEFSSTINDGARLVMRLKVLVVSVTALMLIVLGTLLMLRLGREEQRAAQSERARIEERAAAAETLRERDEQLRQVQKLEAVGRLAGGVAHDFNNLLTVIQGNLEVVRTSGPLGSDLDEALDDAVRAAERAAGLTAQLLTFSRRQISVSRVLQLNEMVSESQSMVQRVIGEGVTLATDLAEDLPPVAGDPAQISQVILNLVLNARDAMPHGGEVRIRTYPLAAGAAVSSAGPPVEWTGAWSVLEVADQGAGMDEETRRRIFEPFFTTKQVGKGTGLGLATVYGIVINLGGTIEVVSAPGTGTTFSVRLPARTWPEVDEHQPMTEGASAGDETILVVEDEASVRTLAVRALSARGYAVHAAVNGVEALRFLSDGAHAVDLVLSDVVMPEMGGRALSQAMRLRGLRTPVVFMSGYTADSDPLICPSGQPPILLQKPFRPRDLALAIRRVLDRTS